MEKNWRKGELLEKKWQETLIKKILKLKSNLKKIILILILGT